MRKTIVFGCVVSATCVLFGVEADMEAYRADRAAKSAAKYGYTVEEWNAMTPMEHLKIRQGARAAAKGMTLEESKADQARRSAERYGYTLEEWNAMPPMEHLKIRQEARAIKAGFTK